MQRRQRLAQTRFESQSPTRTWQYPSESDDAASDESDVESDTDDASKKSWNVGINVASPHAQTPSATYANYVRRVSSSMSSAMSRPRERRKVVEETPDAPSQLAMSAFTFVGLGLFTNFVGSTQRWLPLWAAILVILLTCLGIGFILGSGPVRKLLWAAFGNKESMAVGTVLYLLWMTSRVLPAVFNLLDEIQQRSGALIATPLLLVFLWSASLGVFALGLLIALLFSYDAASATQRALAFVTKYLFSSYRSN